MLFKEADRMGMKTRWIAAVSLLAIAGSGLYLALPARSRVAPAATQPSAAPATSVPARMHPADPATQARVATSFGNLPLSFEPNQGQTDAQVKFLSRNSRYNLFLTPAEAVFTLPVHAPQKKQGHATSLAARSKHSTIQSEAVLRMEILGGNPAAQVTGATEIAGHSNYFIGRDASKWVRDVPHYARVNYSAVYPGIDLTFYGQQRQLEFDFVVKPGADPKNIALGIEGAKQIRTVGGDLVLQSAAGDVRLLKPVAYQQLGDTRQPVDARFVVKGTQVALALGNYDRTRELVIDPSVIYSTYLGAGSEDDGYGIAVDAAGAAYVTGQTSSPGFPLKNVLPAPNNALQGTSDAFVTKLSADGSTLSYSTFLGGTGADSGNAIAIDSTLQAYITGSTNSTDFPMFGNSAQVTPGGGQDAFVAVLSATGNAIVYSTYLGGSNDELSEGIAVDANGIYIAGSTSSSDFPASIPSGSVLQSTFQGGTGTSPSDGFVTKLKALPDGSVFASVFLGGAGNDVATDVAVDSASNVYATGATFSTNFPTTSGVFQTQCGTDGNCNGGQEDSFVTEIKANFSAYQYSTYLGGSGGDDASQIVVDGSGNAYVAGVTNSTNFPTNGTNGAYKTTLGSGAAGNAFVTVVKPGGASLLYSTYLGGSGLDTALAVALDTASPPKLYVTGQTSSTNFPVVSATQGTIGGGNDAFVSEINPNVSGTSSLVFSTYLGGTADEDHFLAGIAVDSSGNFYVTGDTQSIKDFPVTAGSFKTTASSSGGSACTGTCRDAFVVKYSPLAPKFNVGVSVAGSPITRGGSATATVTVTSTGQTGTVNLIVSCTPAAAVPPGCAFASGQTTSVNLTSATDVETATVTISTVKPAVSPATGAAMWLPIPGLALLGAGFLPSRSGKNKLLRRLLAGMALTGLLLLAGCGSGNGGGGGGGGGGGTTTGTYTVTSTGTVAGVGSVSGNATFVVQ